ncbi:MAG: hypothetical protein DME19_11685 [Verrucomicrobia bacterium]|nr:MAG: hypothetical protein DME19_11685 [Verrucomicrobiota bacterium]
MLQWEQQTAFLALVRAVGDGTLSLLFKSTKMGASVTDNDPFRATHRAPWEGRGVLTASSAGGLGTARPA